jgi:hypothetical protein
MENLKLWKSVSTTDPAYAKGFNNGSYSGTAVDSMWQVMKATEKFGPFGIGWGLSDESYQIVTLDEKTKIVIYTGVLWYWWEGKQGNFPVTSSVRIMYQARSERVIYDDEATKKAQTNAISKGLSRLGFSSDVFLGKFDDSKYVELAKAIADAERVIDDVQFAGLSKLLKESKTEEVKFLDHFKATNLREFPAQRYHEAVSMLNAKIRKSKGG